MLIPHPSKLQRHEKYPPKYTVSTLQQVRSGNQEVPVKNKHPRQHTVKMPPNQSTMDQFITKGNTQTTVAGSNHELKNADAAALTDADFPILNFHAPEEGSEPQG